MEIKAKRILTILSIVISSIFVFQNCNYFKSSNFVTVLNHKIIYDSINYKGNDFKVNLYTTLEFNESTIDREKYNDFLLIIKKDTFALVPEVNYLEKESHSDRIQIKYFSQINFQSKIFNNDSIFNVVKTSSKIIDSRGKEIYKNGVYDIVSLVALHLPKKTNSVKF